jgi:hypothetical protein
MITRFDHHPIQMFLALAIVACVILAALTMFVAAQAAPTTIPSVDLNAAPSHSQIVQTETGEVAVAALLIAEPRLLLRVQAANRSPNKHLSPTCRHPEVHCPPHGSTTTRAMEPWMSFNSVPNVV